MARRMESMPTIILVEDDQDTRQEMKNVLELNGYRVIDTDNGGDAVETAMEVRPDLVFVDLDVPLLYGIVAARNIVKKAQLGTIPVVVVSHDDAAEGYPMEVGVRRNEYVTRLADYEQLEHLLDYLLPTAPIAA